MNDTPDLTPIPGDTPSEPASESATILAALRERHVQTQQAQDHHLDLPIPRFGGDIVVRYEPIPYSKVQQITDRAVKAKHPLATLWGNADMLIASCREILGMGTDGKLHVLLGKDDAPLRFDDRLAEEFAIPTDGRARKVVQAMFANDLALAVAGGEVSQWMPQIGQEVDEDYLGE